MWKIKELKSEARKVVKKNYWTAIVICFLLAMLTGEFGISILGWIQKEESLDPIYIINQEQIVGENVNQDKIDEIKSAISKMKTKIENVKEKILPGKFTEVQQKVLEMIKANVNSATKSQKYILKIWDAVTSFNINEPFLGITLSITAVISLLFTIIMGNPLIVAGRKYFLVARKEDNLNTIDFAKDIFKKGNWLNVSVTMFLRSFYNLLWYITIIGGIIKMYEYRMIPYILAENPKIERKKAFELSKQMMKKNKWRAFLLDLSFIGWTIASIILLGIINILYANPYKAATSAELYVTLRNDAISRKCKYYEEITNNA